MRKKVSVIILVCMAFLFNAESQNLVPNYSFEDTIRCPTQPFYFQGYVSNWSGIEPGYFTPFCNDGGVGGMPLNSCGYQYPHSGKAYTGIYTFLNAGTDTTSPSYKISHNLRDYIEVQLTTSLVNSVRYYVTFYVSLGDSFKYACNNIGACFSDSSLKFSRKVLSYHTPQVTNDTSHHLTDKINWMKVTGSFKAQGGEQYVIIGNFTDDSHADTIYADTIGYPVHQWWGAYYFIDDIIVTIDSNYADSLFPTSLQNISKPEEVVNVYPNPSNNILTVQFATVPQQGEHFCLYNLMGEQVESFQLNQSVTSMSVAKLSSGIYLYRMLDKNEALVQLGKIIVAH